MFHIKRMAVIRRLFDRYQLDQVGDAIPIGLYPGVIPVTDADALLQEWGITREDITISATGWVEVLTVPSGEIWHIYAINASQSSGTFTISMFGINDGGSNHLPVISFTGATGKQWFTEKVFTMPEGWRLMVYCNAHTTAGDESFLVYKAREDAF